MVEMNGKYADAAYQNYNAVNKTGKTESAGATKKSDYGRTIGKPVLSEKAQQYYEELKSKYSNYDFILVSRDQKANAQANAGAYANASKMVVLIDEDKIERMATDENYRKQYEAIISNAASGLSQMKTSMDKLGLGSNVKGYGMQVNDGGTASLFAVLKKSSADQKARIEKKREEAKAEKKAEAAKADKERQQERLEKYKTDDRYSLDDDTITITADSIEELMQKINDYTMAERSDNVLTDFEKLVGQNIDFRG